MSISKFLTYLGRGGKYQYFVSFDGKGMSNYQLFEVGKIPPLPNWDMVYFSVNPLGKEPEKKKSKVEDVIAMNCFFAEFDGKDFSCSKYTSSDWAKQSLEVRQKANQSVKEYIDTLDPQPSIIIFSGGGYHCYWLLRETKEITDEKRDEINNLHHKWVEYVKGDNGAKDISRILRVPGSYNKKYNPPVRVEFVKEDYSITYDFDDLAEFIKEKPVIEQDKQSEKSEKSDNLSKIEMTTVIEAVNQLKKERADNYENWLNVGMVLHSLGDEYLAIWDSWSKQSSKYEPGICAQKWQSFTGSGGLTVSSLYYWAEQDSKGVYVRPAPKGAKPSAYSLALHSMGYSFSMNRMNDRVYVNGQLISDGLSSLIITKLRESDYKSNDIAEDVYIAEAYQNQFHPVEDYLTSLSWDGEDHITTLCSYFIDKDGIFPLLIRKWLVGAVAKILGKRKGEQNPMLVLDGKQGIGKSRFSWWLCSGIPQFYKTSPIYPDNKDHVIDSVSHFIWEVEELGSTIRRADREALKAFITRENASFRPPYGKYEISKPVTCNYIGTINNESGFLSDPTGNRRFRVCTIQSIDWNYSKNIDVNRIWAQAVHLFNTGETSILSTEENQTMSEINSRYEVEDIVGYYINQLYDIDPENKNWFYPSAKIIEDFKNKNLPIHDSDINLNRRVGAVLTKFGCENGRKRINSQPIRGWVGVYPKGQREELPPFGW